MHIEYRQRSREWELKCLGLAFDIAARFSKDPTTKVGAVVEGQARNEMAFGWNGFPPGISDDDRMNERDLKNLLTVHAEQNAILNAPFRPVVLYSTHFPCLRHKCVQTIIAKRSIRRVVTVRSSGEFKERWGADQAAALELFEEAEIDVIQYHKFEVSHV